MAGPSRSRALTTVRSSLSAYCRPRMQDFPEGREHRRGVRIAKVLGLLHHIPPGMERGCPLWGVSLCPLPCGWVLTISIPSRVANGTANSLPRHNS